MATILKKSFVYKCLSSLSEAQLTSLGNLVRGVNVTTPTDLSLLPNDVDKISTSNKGVSYVRLFLNKSRDVYIRGFLCYTDSYCGLFGFKGTDIQCMGSYSIDVSTLCLTSYDAEKLSIEEFEREIDDMTEAAPGGKDAWVEAMKSVVNTSNNNVHFTNEGFVEIINQLKVNDIHCRQTREGEPGPAVHIENADLRVGGADDSYKIYLNGTELGGGGGHKITFVNNLEETNSVVVQYVDGTIETVTIGIGTTIINKVVTITPNFTLQFNASQPICTSGYDYNVQYFSIPIEIECDENGALLPIFDTQITLITF